MTPKGYAEKGQAENFHCAGIRTLIAQLVRLLDLNLCKCLMTLSQMMILRVLHLALHRIKNFTQLILNKNKGSNSSRTSFPINECQILPA